MASLRTITSSCAGAGLVLGLALAWSIPTTMPIRAETILPQSAAVFPHNPPAPDYYTVPTVHAPLYTYVDGERRPVFEDQNGNPYVLPEPRSAYAAPEQAEVEPVPDMAVTMIDESGAHAVRTAVAGAEDSQDDETVAASPLPDGTALASLTFAQ